MYKRTDSKVERAHKKALSRARSQRYRQRNKLKKTNDRRKKLSLEDFQGEQSRVKRVELTENKNDFISKCLSMMGIFRAHVDRVTAQFKAVHELKASLPKGHVTIQTDFSEN